MSDNGTPPIEVSASPMGDQIASALRVVVLCISVITALAGLVAKRDLAGFILYVQSSDFIAFSAFVVGGATFAWGQWKTRHRAKQLTTITADPRTPDAVAVLK